MARKKANSKGEAARQGTITDTSLAGVGTITSNDGAGDFAFGLLPLISDITKHKTLRGKAVTFEVDGANPGLAINVELTKGKSARQGTITDTSLAGVGTITSNDGADDFAFGLLQLISDIKKHRSLRGRAVTFEVDDANPGLAINVKLT